MFTSTRASAITSGTPLVSMVEALAAWSRAAVILDDPEVARVLARPWRSRFVRISPCQSTSVVYSHINLMVLVYHARPAHVKFFVWVARKKLSKEGSKRTVVRRVGQRECEAEWDQEGRGQPWAELGQIGSACRRVAEDDRRTAGR
jgi:hypothetical protein